MDYRARITPSCSSMHEVSLSNWWLIIPPLFDCTNCCYIISQKYAPLVTMHKRAPDAHQAHTRKAEVPRPLSARAPLSLPPAAQSRAFAVIALDDHQGGFQEHRRRQMNFLVVFGDVAPANFGPCSVLNNLLKCVHVILSPSLTHRTY